MPGLLRAGTPPARTRDRGTRSRRAEHLSAQDGGLAQVSHREPSPLAVGLQRLLPRLGHAWGGVPLTTVQAWLGHGSIQITARYLHHLGDFADRTALDVLNSGASKALSERAKKLPGLSRFGTTDPHRQAPDRGHGLGR